MRVSRWRRAVDKYGRVYVNFTPAVSRDAVKAMRQTIRGWHLQLKSDKSLADLSAMFAPPPGYLCSGFGPLGEKGRSGRQSEQIAAGLARFRYFRLSASVRSPNGGSWWAETAASRCTMPFRVGKWNRLVMSRRMEVVSLRV